MEIRAAKFRVHRQWRHAGLYRPTEAETGAGVLMLHGFPGIQKNEDIAAELCRRGLSVLMPHYRGCWGSPGEFSVHGAIEDAAKALGLLSRYHHIDPSRIGLLGYSVGGWIALRLAAQRPVAAVAVMAPAPPRSNEDSDKIYLRKHGKVISIPDIKALWNEYLAAAREDHPDAYIRHISPTPLLIMQGLKDHLVPPTTSYVLWTQAGWPKDIIQLPNEDHEFQNDRPRVVSTLCDWMQAHLAAKRREPKPAARAALN
ncbi:MAG: alpha/beta fold hydrolase [Elusimicrobiota bacterium]